MKRIRVIVPAIAILIGSIAALASRSQQQGCALTPQYYYNGTAYIPAGVLGRDYFCANGTGSCTYYGGNGTYLACQSGVYTPLNAATPQKKK